tara:strand:- start:352 stop:909 length:558 start_codon:yes stop_codon:yes gene_type:complete
MQYSFSSILLLTILLAIGLVFFLRAASKDRTTVIDICSPLPPLEVLNGITLWLEERGWKSNGGDAQSKVLRFNGSVSSSLGLAIFLSALGGLGAACLGLVLIQLYPDLGWWPLSLSILGAPTAGFIYWNRASRIETLELKLISFSEGTGSSLRLRAHRDEIISMELELSKRLKLRSDGSLLSSPI